MEQKNSSQPLVTKAKAKTTVKRLVKEYLLTDKLRVITMVLAGLTGVTLTMSGPKILGQGTNVLFAGIVGVMLEKQGIPAGTSKADVVKLLQEHGNTNIANMVSNMDVVVGKGIDWNLFAIIMGIALAVFTTSILLRLLQNFLLTRVVSNAVYRMRMQIDRKLDRVPLQYFDRVPRGEIMSRTTNDVDNITQTLQQIMGELFWSVFMVLGVFGIMLTISLDLTLIIFVSIILMILIASLIVRKSQPNFVAQWKSTGEVNGIAEEMISGHTVIRAYGQQSRAEGDFDESNTKLYKSSFKASLMSLFIQPISYFFGNLNFLLIVVIGGIKILSGTMSLGDLQAFAQYSRQISQPIGQLASMSAMLQSSLASCQRIFEFLDEPEESDESYKTETLTQISGKSVQGHVRFDNVYFSYDEKKPLIEGLSLEAKPGQTVAIVGPTGAGKTTLVNLLMRFYDIQGGAITIDGVNITDVSRQNLRKNFGMVLQDTWLFDGTIRDNLLYGVHDKSKLSEEELLAGAKATHVDEFIRRLPNGYDTVLSEQSGELSQGERQLLTICRAFLSDPNILILDEATSSVDTRTEMLVQQAMNTLRSGRTSFVIAHRLSTIKDADLILVVNQGAIVEQGTHEELLELGGSYAKLYNSQFGSEN